MKFFIKFLIIVGLLALSFSCGYTVSSNPSVSKSEQGKRIYLLVFQNFTHPYKPGIDILLHKSLSQALMQSSYKLTTDENKADYLITGEIVDYKQAVLSTAPDQTPTEVQVAIKVRVKIVDNAGKERNVVVQHKPEPFALVLGESLEEAEKRGIRNTAEQIILILAGEVFISD